MQARAGPLTLEHCGMSNPEPRAMTARFVRGALTGAVFVAGAAHAQVPAPNPNGPKANWALFEKFSTANMRGMTFSTNVQSRWVGETDSLFYSWEDHTGRTFFLVNAVTKQKKPLFDHVKLAAQLSILHRKAFDPDKLPFSTLNFTKDHKHLRFQVDSTRYDWTLATETLTSMGRYRGQQDSLMTRDEEVQQGGGGGGRGGGGRGGGRGGPPGPGGGAQDFRNWSPDSTAFVFGRNNNLYVFEKASGDTIQITTEGIEGYSFTAGGGRGGGGLDSLQQQQQQDENNQQEGRGQNQANRSVRVQATWSGDSKAFFVTRTDRRADKYLWLVNVLSEPRPTLQTYPYAMPGEDTVPRPEYYTYTRGERVAKKLPVAKFKDQQYFNAAFPTRDGSKMRIIRRDRLQRNLEYVEVDIPTGQTKILVTESKGDAGSLEMPNPRYLKQGGDFLWWSERTGWGHYFLYAYDGTLKRQLTSGAWRAEPNPVEIDSVRGVLYVRGEGREAGENAYYQHLYRVNIADAGIVLLDPGNAHHTSQLSSNKKWVIDNFSRIDTVPRSVLRDAMTGKAVMDLEVADLSLMVAAGWRPPEAFQTLAADGVTPIYGNMWKPFDFDSTKKYPIIANVYPGPQTESVTNGFTAGGGPQQLAQLGFIVIQIGNRGGNPARSAAYQDFSYFNMRDYALADKKTGIEQLAARHKWIDIDRVGIYGHSGGGFLTAAALLLPPYNEFFKVGVSESGNHDNNIYNSNWSEQYHGLRWVSAADTACLTARARGRECTTGSGTAVAAGRGAGRGNVGGRGGGGGNGGRGGGRGGVQAGGRGGPGANGNTDGGAESAPADSVLWIYIPTNIDLAQNLKGKLLLETGDMDNNVHPGNTIRLVNALIQNGKRFDFMIYPGQPHAYGPMAPYAFQLQAEYFAEFLLGDNSFRRSADFRSHTDR
jgi:dipeptidyl-peptidase-4